MTRVYAGVTVSGRFIQNEKCSGSAIVGSATDLSNKGNLRLGGVLVFFCSLFFSNRRRALSLVASALLCYSGRPADICAARQRPRTGLTTPLRSLLFLTNDGCRTTSGDPRSACTFPDTCHVSCVLTCTLGLHTNE